MQTNRQSKLVTRVCRGFFRLLLALASIFLLGMLVPVRAYRSETVLVGAQAS